MNIDILASGTDGTYKSIKWCYDEMKTGFQNISGYIDGTTSGATRYNNGVDEVMVMFYKNFAGTIISHIQNYGAIKVPIAYMTASGNDYDILTVKNKTNGLDGFIINSHVDSLAGYDISGTNEISGSIE